MKILLVAVNAKFIHTNLAVRSLKAYARLDNVDFCEYTINNEPDYVLKNIYLKKPDVLCFSSYIWNIEFVKSIAESLKILLPETVIVLGGPEVSYESAEFLKSNEWADIIIKGEGEVPFRMLAEYYTFGSGVLSQIPSITYRENGVIKETAAQSPVPLDEIPFAYSGGELPKGRILYYETQRGCPFSCSYCLSAGEKLRFLSEERVKKDISVFISNEVKQVKFVDRTFNADKRHAMAIWKYIAENDRGKTNFHMEITAGLLDDEELEFLSGVRKGLFQFEIGVQSTNEETLSAISRKNDFEAISYAVRRLKEAGNIHLHLDLIAGLPFEDYGRFKKSFNDVYSLRPEKLQLGFLKLLFGSRLRSDAQRYGILASPRAPYEVLYTQWLPYDGLLKLKAAEAVLELYYNSNAAVNALSYLEKSFASPFDMYEELGAFWDERGGNAVKRSRTDMFTFLYEFCAEKKADVIEAMSDLLKFDLYCGDNAKPPYWAEEEASARELKRDFLTKKENVDFYLKPLSGFSLRQISNMCEVISFSYDVAGFANEPQKRLLKRKTEVLFNYYPNGGKKSRAVFFDISGRMEND